MTTVGSPDARLRTFISRILRLKSDQDDTQTDIQAVYAEAKAEGYDKTAMGQVVSIIRKRLKDPSKFEEQSSVVQMYLDAFEGAEPRTHARAREGRAQKAASTPHNPTTGEVLEATPAPSAEEIGAAAYAEEPPSPSDPRSLADGAPAVSSPSACANPAAGQQFQGQSGMTASTPYRLEPRVPAPDAPAEPQHELIASAEARWTAARALLGQAQEAAE